MKLKQVIMLVLIGLPLDVYCPAGEPVKFEENAKVSKTKKSVSFESSQDAAIRANAEAEQAANQNKKEQSSSQQDNATNTVQPKSALKDSTGLQIDDSLDVSHLDPFDLGVEGSYDYGEAVNNKTLDLTEDNTVQNSKQTVDVSKDVERNKQQAVEKKQAAQAEHDAAIKLAKDLETEARSAKTDEDVKIIIKKIDPQGKLTPEVIDEAVQASKIWRNPFNGSAWERFVEVLSRTVSYATKGKPFSKESVESLKKLVTDHADSIKIDKDAKRAEEVKQAKIQELDNQIAVKNDDLEAVNKDISDIQTQITIKQNDIETHVQTNYIIKTRSLGDSQAVIELEAQITQLRSKLIESQKEASKLLQDMRQLEDQKNSMSSQEELFKESESSDVSTSSKKEESLCDTVEACVERIKDPKDSNSLSKILTRVGELAKNPDVMKNLTQDQIDAVNFFVKNGDKIINNFKSLTWSETYSLMKYKDSLPTLKGSKPLDTSVLISKSSKESELVKSEQQQIAAQSSSSLFA